MPVDGECSLLLLYSFVLNVRFQKPVAQNSDKYHNLSFKAGHSGRETMHTVLYLAAGCKPGELNISRIHHRACVNTTWRYKIEGP